MVKVRILNKSDNKNPSYQTPGSSGMDLHAFLEKDSPIVMTPHSTHRVPTGLYIEIPEGYEGQIRPRSGLASEGNPAILGTIDSDYRGELQVVMHNSNHYLARVINSGDRIAQLVICPVVQVELEIMEEVTGTSRGSNGFGSTGV